MRRNNAGLAKIHGSCLATRRGQQPIYEEFTDPPFFGGFTKRLGWLIVDRDTECIDVVNFMWEGTFLGG